MNHFSSDGKIQLRACMARDEATIANWPIYSAEFADIDYALRQDGWLAEFRGQPDTWIYVAEQSGELIACTILSLTAQGEAEFRIALRADKAGQGLGRILTANHRSKKQPESD